MDALAAFSDVAVAVNCAPGPPRGVLGWEPVTDCGSLTLWSSSGPRANAVTVRQPSNDMTACLVGDVWRYRGSDIDALDRFVCDLRDERGAPEHLAWRGLLVVVDAAADRVHIFTDRFGTQHAYLCQTGRSAMVSTCAATVNGMSNRALDWLGIAGMCAYGFFPGRRTWWEGVTIVPPASWTTISSDGSVLGPRRYWNWHFEPVRRPVPGLLDELASVLAASLRRSCRGRSVALPLSGGLDSRLLAGLVSDLTDSDVAAHAFSYGYGPSSIETRIATAVGRACSMPVECEAVRDYLFEELDIVLDAVEGFTALTLSRQISAAETIARLGDLVVGGHWGDVWFDSALPAGASGGNLLDVALTKFSKRGGDWLVEHLIEPNTTAGSTRDDLRDLLAWELRGVPDLGDDDMRLKAFKTDQWSFRWTLASTRAYQVSSPIVLPFYDPDVVDLFLTIPSQVHVGRSLQQELLRARYPALAAVPWQQTGRSLLEAPPSRAASLAQRAAGRAIRALRREHVIERNWEVQLRSPSGRVQVEQALHNGPIAQLVPRASIDQLLADFNARVDPGVGYAVDMLVTVNAWLDRFAS